MPLVYRNECNKEMKSILKREKITYSLLGREAGYSPGTIAQWMIKPLTPQRKEIIDKAIQNIMNMRKDKGGGYATE